MKNKFKGYYQLSPSDFDELWKNATFIFDTNVLLNLYRYQESTRESLLSIIEKLNDRVWIPYHVGLEFQRNRLKVIAEQHKKYYEVESVISKHVSKIELDLAALQLEKRHSHINPCQLITAINTAKDAFIEQLNDLKGLSISVSSDDEIRNRIDELFDNKIGDPPEDQKTVNKLFNVAEERYKNLIPPGFMDAEKDKGKSDEFTYGAITYKRKYGDYLIWNEIIEYAKKESLKDIIFITDDNKQDWWWQVESDGNKTLGVRPELVDEITREANIERFYAYNSEKFVSYANKQLKTNVTNEIIEEIRNVSTKSMSQRELPFYNEAAGAVLNWLYDNFSNFQDINEGMPFHITSYNNEMLGFNTIVEFDTNVLELGLSLAEKMISMGFCNRVITICIIPRTEQQYLKMIERILFLKQNDKLGIVVGEVLQYIPVSKSNIKESIIYDFSPYFFSRTAAFILQN